LPELALQCRLLSLRPLTNFEDDQTGAGAYDDQKRKRGGHSIFAARNPATDAFIARASVNGNGVVATRFFKNSMTIGTGRRRFAGGPVYVRYGSHTRHEAVASPGNGGDVRMFVRAFTQGFSQRGDGLGEIAFLDVGVRPHLRHEFILHQHLSLMTDHRHENLEGFQTEWNDLSVSHQDRLRRIHDERTELVETYRFLSLYRFHTTNSPA
jgi:hypothetical protein